MRFLKTISLLLVLLLGIATRSSQAQISLLLTFASDPNGLSLTGLGLLTANAPFGNVRAFGGTVPTGVTRTVGANSFSLSTPIDIAVTGVGIVNPTYTMAVKLTSLDSTNVWTVNSITFTGSAFTTISTTNSYNVFIPFTVSITFPFSEAPGLVSNTINFMATGN
jgi:hypothetical protein